ncbi:MAG: RpiB/LacA/LacB family sugar-phosphate isomerase [bacterium]
MCAMDEKALARPFRVAVASDHAGFDLKTQIIRLLSDLGHEVEDFGARSAEPVDFADYVYPAALAVSDGRLERAILLLELRIYIYNTHTSCQLYEFVYIAGKKHDFFPYPPH